MTDDQRHLYHDDPRQYYKRLCSYRSYRDYRSDSDPIAPPKAYTSSERKSRTDSRPRPRPLQRPESYAESGTESYTESRIDSYAGSRADAHTKSRPGSYAHSRNDSYTSYRPESYASSHPLTHDNGKSEVTFDTRKAPKARRDRRGSYDNEKSDVTYDSEKAPRRGRGLRHDDLKEHDALYEPPRSWWTRKRKIVIFSSIAVFIILLVIIIAVAVVRSRKPAFAYTPSNTKVTNEKAFQSGGATHSSVNDTSTGIGTGQDRYVYYKGGPENFPPHTAWVSFEDMWKANLPGIQASCTNLKSGENDTPEEMAYIYNAIQDRANASLVDHRYILATVLQESHGCIHVGETTSSGGVTNPGLMQSHNGDSFSESSPELSILAMIQDGTQGTEHGAGLVQNLNKYGDPYSASRGYNSGYIPKSGDLSEAAGATACYVTDVANRLTGWVNADSTCPGDY